MHVIPRSQFEQFIPFLTIYWTVKGVISESNGHFDRTFWSDIFDRTFSIGHFGGVMGNCFIFGGTVSKLNLIKNKSKKPAMICLKGSSGSLPTSHKSPSHWEINFSSIFVSPESSRFWLQIQKGLLAPIFLSFLDPGQLAHKTLRTIQLRKKLKNRPKLSETKKNWNISTKTEIFTNSRDFTKISSFNRKLPNPYGSMKTHISPQNPILRPKRVF